MTTSDEGGRSWVGNDEGGKSWAGHGDDAAIELHIGAVSIDCADPGALADFYADLLGMTRIAETPDGRVIAVSDGTHTLAMMRVDDYVAPTWPAASRPQQMHFDISVTDLDRATARASSVGARLAEHQPAPDLWRVLLDPAGHPFCLTTFGA